MNAGRRVEFGIGHAHDLGHRAAGGEAGDIDARMIDGQFRGHGAGQAGDDAGLALHRGSDAAGLNQFQQPS